MVVRRSQSRIQHIDNILSRPSRPISTRLLHDIRQLDLVFEVSFDKVEVHAFGYVPSDVALNNECTGKSVFANIITQ